MPSLRRSALIWLSLGTLALVSTACAQETSGKFFITVYHLPEAFFRRTDSADPHGPLRLAPGVKPWNPKENPPSMANAYDVREFFTTSTGVNFPEGTLAIFFPDEGALFLQHTRKNLERLRASSAGGETFPFLATEITVVTLTLPESWFTQNTIDYAALRKAAGESWKVVDALQFVNKTGVTAHIPRVGGGSTITSDNPGRVEAVIDASGTLVDVAASFRYQSPGGGELRYEGECTLKDGHPQVLQLVSHGGKSGDGRIAGHAVIMRSTITATGPQRPE